MMQQARAGHPMEKEERRPIRRTVLCKAQVATVGQADFLVLA